MDDFFVNASVQNAADTVAKYVEASAMSAELKDRHDMTGNGCSAVTMVFEKYFMRNSSRASLTVAIDDLGGKTRVHTVGSGGGESTFFGFDWGAGQNFEGNVREALNDYICG
jgi:hypothetical protein